MNRSTFFKTLFGGIAAAPSIVKVIAEEPKVLESRPEMPKPNALFGVMASGAAYPCYFTGMFYGHSDPWFYGR